MIDFIYRRGNKWTLMFIDSILVVLSIVAAFGLRFNFKIPSTYLVHMAYGLPFTLLIRVSLFLVFKTHTGLIKYSGFDDIKRIVYSIALGSLGFYLLNLVFYSLQGYYFLPIPVLIIDFMLCGFLIVSTRALAKLYIINKESVHTETKNVLILGAGTHAISTKKTLDQDTKVNYEFYGFVDDTKTLKGRQLDGLNIYSTSFDFEALIDKNKIDILLLCNNKTRLANRQKLLDICLAKGVKILDVPDSDKWINGALSVNQLKEINIESLLERDPIQLDFSKIESQIKGSKVLVTGGAGSIGSEMVRQILKFGPAKVMVLDQAESALYDMELELKENFSESNFEIVLADIRNMERMRRVFAYFKPDYVYHAAAYKHVPMMENNPSESIMTNVFGSINLAKLALEFKVKKFVMISTDKAVNPTNVMGASKRVAEIFVQSLDSKLKNEGNGGTQYITTRFGNVLGSNGSVIQLFKKQLKNGGPLTITHPDVTRYFMTIPEASQLVLEAGMMGQGGEIFVFDMGKSVKIIDLAKNMIKLAGLELGKDINIVSKGLRPGEKLYEELLNDQENSMPTHHEKIMIGKVREYDFEEVDQKINELVALFETQDNDMIVAKMKELVPEYISNNSTFSRLDK
jgi:FlaA1/EpsC-like NDP-sugar epimerase